MHPGLFDPHFDDEGVVNHDVRQLDTSSDSESAGNLGR